MPALRKTYTVKVTAEYWATIECEPDEDLSTDEIEDLANTQMYDESHRIEIYSTHIDDMIADCDDCGMGGVEEDHECDEDETDDEGDDE